MVRRALLAGCALAITLAACSDGAPEAEDSAAAPASAMAAADAVVEDVASADDAVAEEAPAEIAQIAEKPKEAEPAPAAPAPAAVVAAVAAPVAEVIKVAETSQPAAYARCVACHTANKGGEDKLGPNLYGVFRTPAAQGGYAYSAALKESGLTWDEATLHKWLENPRALVPGNRMSFPGIKDAAKRQEIIDYLKKQS